MTDGDPQTDVDVVDEKSATALHTVIHLTFKESERTLCGGDGTKTADEVLATCWACQERALKMWW